MATVLMLAGGGLMAGSMVAEGRAAEKQGSFAKKIAARNQQVLERQAKAEMEAARIEEQQISRREKIIEGSQIAAAGGQISGATLNFLADTARQFSLSRNFALRTGLLKSQQLQEQGNIVMAQGRWAKSVGSFQKRMAFIKAGATLGMAGGSAFQSTPPTGQVNTGQGSYTQHFSQSSFNTPSPG